VVLLPSKFAKHGPFSLEAAVNVLDSPGPPLSQMPRGAVFGLSRASKYQKKVLML
jgi:hypothetical protein